MNRLPLTTSHAKCVSDARPVVFGSPLQPVIFTSDLHFRLPEALPQNKVNENQCLALGLYSVLSLAN